MLQQLIALSVPIPELINYCIKTKYNPNEYFWRLRLLKDYEVDPSLYTITGKSIYKKHYQFDTIPRKKVVMTDEDWENHMIGKYTKVTLRTDDFISYKGKMYCYSLFMHLETPDDRTVDVWLYPNLDINAYNNAFDMAKFCISDSFYSEIIKNQTLLNEKITKSYIDLFEGKRLILYYRIKLEKTNFYPRYRWLNSYHFLKHMKTVEIKSNEYALYLCWH
jgi:hypothetical protein